MTTTGWTGEDPDGAPALPEVTSKVEELFGKTTGNRPKGTAQKAAKNFDPRDGYLADLERVEEEIEET